MKRQQRLTIIILMMAAALVSAAPAADSPADRVKLAINDLFFTEPYAYLKAPVKDRIGMSLDLNYIEMRYPGGFANTINGKDSPLEFGMRMTVSDPEQIKKIETAVDVNRNDRFTVISAAGRGYFATVTGFSYVANSPSTVTVMADLRLDEKADPALFRSHALAVRGLVKFTTPSSITTGQMLSPADPLREKLLTMCASNLKPGNIMQDATVMPAPLEEGQTPFYFVSYWQLPPNDFEIDDVLLTSCLYKGNGKNWSQASLPISFQALQVQDLDRDGFGEIYALTGDGSEVCYIYMVPRDGSYMLLKKGLCAGY